MTDRALHEALRQKAEQEPLHLPSNFAYTTMRRIQQEQRVRERQERVTAAVTIAVCCLLGIGGIIYFYGEALLRGCRAMVQQSEGFSMVPGIAFCFCFLATLNYFLHRHFSKL